MNLRNQPEVDAEIQRAKQWLCVSSQLAEGIQVEASLRYRIAGALFLISMEHQTGIILLMDGQLVAPARALLRSQLDAFMRGVWFLEKATEDQIREFAGKQYAKNVPPVRYRELVDAIETINRYSDSSFADLESTIRMLHDFTHGGKLAVTSHLKGDEIIPNFCSADVTSYLESSGLLGFLACREMAGMTNQEDLPDRVLSAYLKIYPEMRRKTESTKPDGQRELGSG